MPKLYTLERWIDEAIYFIIEIIVCIFIVSCGALFALSFI